MCKIKPQAGPNRRAPVAYAKRAKVFAGYLVGDKEGKLRE